MMFNGGGLRMDLGGGAQVRTVNNPTPATATAAGFGPGYTQPGLPSQRSALLPNDPFGVAFWAGVGAIFGLLFIRYSLPA